MEFVILLAILGAVAIGVVKYRSGASARHAEQIKQKMTALLPQQFVIFDLETTGLDAAKHEIIEIGAIRAHRDSDTHDTFSCLVKPKRKVPKRITEITGITQEMVEQDGQPLDSALRQFHEFVGDRHLVAFNAEFDMAFLRAAEPAAGVRFHNDIACALEMARRAWPGRRSYKLKELSADGGLDTSDSHRALGDCKRTLLVYTSAVTLLGRIR